jgi:hypothetical protein
VDLKAFRRAVPLRRVNKLNHTPRARAKARATAGPAELSLKHCSRIGSRFFVFALTVDGLEWSQSDQKFHRTVLRRQVGW